MKEFVGKTPHIAGDRRIRIAEDHSLRLIPGNGILRIFLNKKTLNISGSSEYIFRLKEKHHWKPFGGGEGQLCIVNKINKAYLHYDYTLGY